MIGNKIQPFKIWCQKVLPNVYDDSLSYYEYLCKMNEYLNEVIDQMNTLTEAEEEYQTNLTAEWETYRTNLTNAWNETKNYIDTYFDNLDVQDEINNKLDNMAANGVLSGLIQPFVTQQIGGVVATQIDDAVEGQIDGAVARQIDEAVAEQISGSASEAATQWLAENVDPVGSAVTVDKSLLIDGSAADSKTVGDIVNQIVIRPVFSNTGYAFTTSTGNADTYIVRSTNANYSYTNNISIKKGDKIYFMAKTDNKYVCPIVKVNADNTMTSLIAGENGTTPREVYYTAVEDMTILLCGRTDGTPYAIIRGTIITEGTFNPTKEIVDSDHAFTESLKPCFGNTNLLDDAIVKQGMMLNPNTGAEQAATSDFYLNIVNVKGGEKYYWTQLSTSIMQAAVYTEDETLIGFLYTLGWTSWNSYFTLPSNAKICKVVVTSGYLATKYFGTMYDEWSNGVNKYVTDKLYINNDDFITVGVGGDYTSITEGFAKAIANNKGVRLLAGTYDLVNEGVTGIGLMCPKHLIGYGAKLILNLSEEDWNMSALNMPQMPECIIEGVEIDVYNGRYCIHDEMYNYSGAYHHVIKNCRLTHHTPISETLLAPRAIGGGIGNAGTVEIYNCYCDSRVTYGDVSYHSNALGTQTGNVYIHMHDNDIAHAIQFASIGVSQTFKNIVYVSNNRFGQILPQNSETANMKQICWNNALSN